jgi:DeoR/GlpR family transcriptional regulator of sugar metabolism
MIREERFERISSELAKRGSVELEELSRLLGVSPATVRRDLDALAVRGLLKRTYGGATADVREGERPFDSKLTAYLPEKRAIGALAASLIPEGSVIGCSGGTTVMSVVRALRGKKVTVVTNAVNVAMELASDDSVEVVVTGGTLRPRTWELVGHIAERTLADFRLDIALLGVDGISLEHGLSTFTIADAHTDFLLMARAASVWVVADHSKFGKVAPALIAPLSRVRRIITDPGMDEVGRASLEAAGLEVRIAPEN